MASRAAQLRRDAELGITFVAGAVLVALVNAVSIALRVPWPGFRQRVVHHLFDAAQSVGCFLVVGALLTLARAALARLPRLGGPLSGAFLIVVNGAWSLWMLGDQLERQSHAMWNGKAPLAFAILFSLGVALALPIAGWLGLFLGRHRRWLVVPLAVGMAVLVGHHVLFPDDYEPVHAVVGTAGALTAGAALAPALARRAFSWRGKRVALVAAGVSLFGIGGLVVSPNNATRLELFKDPGCFGAWLLADTVWSLPTWDRAAVPDHPSLGGSRSETHVPAVSPSPVVVLITVDALRADVVNDAANDARFAALARMKRVGTWFNRAYAPGSQTSVSLASMFTGKGFSALRWAPHGEGTSRFLYPAADPSPRFVAGLREVGAHTVHVASLTFLTSEFGIASGFNREIVTVSGRRHAAGSDVLDGVLKTINAAGSEPLFVYAHFMEPHAPYDRSDVKGSEWERYLGEIDLVDDYIGRIDDALRRPELDGRSYFIVSADHGEAFGEHGTTRHTKTLYEELIRVPLLVRGPGVAHQRVDERVSLIDVGPTVLEVFGAPPSGGSGTSLVPILRGKESSVGSRRLVFAEGRLRQALFWQGLKVIVDRQRKTIEVYDVDADPRETVNLFDQWPTSERVRTALTAAEAFFERNRVADDGYEVPYKP